MSLASSGKIIKILSAISPFIALAGIVLLQSQEYKKSVQKLNNADYLIQEQEQARLVNWQKQSFHLGFDNLKADWSYLNFVQYFGDSNARETIGYKLVPDYFDTITNIDPKFTAAHLNLSIANSMYAGDPEKTIALTEEILASVDSESEHVAFLWTSKGLDELLFMGDKEAAIESYKMAVKSSALTSLERPDGLTIKDLEKALKDTSEIDIKQAQIRAWSSVLTHIKDYQKHREIVDKITNLKAEIVALEQVNLTQH